MSLLARIYNTDTAEMVKEIEVSRFVKAYLLFREQVKLEGKVMTYNDLIANLVSLQLTDKSGKPMSAAAAKATVDFCISTGILLLFEEKPMPQQTGFVKYYLVESTPF